MSRFDGLSVQAFVSLKQSTLDHHFGGKREVHASTKGWSVEADPGVCAT